MRLVSLTVEVLAPDPVAPDEAGVGDQVDAAVAALAARGGWLPNVHASAPPEVRRWVSSATVERI